MDHVRSMLAALSRQPKGVLAWVVVLGIVHGVGPWLFIEQPAAQAMAVAFLIAVVCMFALFVKFGLARILGLAHAPWIPAWWALWNARPDTWPADAFGTWVGVALVTGAISLVIDAVDVVRWLRGERDAT